MSKDGVDAVSCGVAPTGNPTPREKGVRDNREGSRWLAEEAMIVGIVTVLGAVSAMAFEVGYANLFFELPVELIVIDAQRMLVVALMTLLGATPVLLYLFFASMFYSEGRPLFKLLGGVMLALAPVAFFLPFVAISPLQWYLAGGVCTIGILVGLVRSLYLKIWHREPLRAGLTRAAAEAVQFVYSVSESKSKPTMFAGIVGCSGLVALPLLWVMAIGARLPAWCQNSVLVDKPDYVFVRRYGDNFVFKEFNTATGEILGGIEIRTLQGEKPISMHGTKMILRGWWTRVVPRKSEDGPADALAPSNVSR